MRILNQAHMLKLAWQLVSNPEKLWVRVMKAKYRCGMYAFPQVQLKTNCSSVWRAIHRVWHHVQQNVSWVIGNGNDTRFWKDSWLPDLHNLESLYSHSIPQGHTNFPVSFYASNGIWKQDLLHQILPDNVCAKILSIKPPEESEDNDFANWTPANDGQFSLKYAYTLLTPQKESVNEFDHNYMLAWKWPGPTRIQSFLWKLMHGRLLTNEERYKRNMTTENNCPRCNNAPESIMHVLRDCEEVTKFWNSIVRPEHWVKFFSLGLHT
jgi:hypothetical protein